VAILNIASGKKLLRKWVACKKSISR